MGGLTPDGQMHRCFSMCDDNFWSGSEAWNGTANGCERNQQSVVWLVGSLQGGRGVGWNDLCLRILWVDTGEIENTDGLANDSIGLFVTFKTARAYILLIYIILD